MPSPLIIVVLRRVRRGKSACTVCSLLVPCRLLVGGGPLRCPCLMRRADNLCGSPLAADFLSTDGMGLMDFTLPHLPLPCCLQVRVLIMVHPFAGVGECLRRSSAYPLRHPDRSCHGRRRGGLLWGALSCERGNIGIAGAWSSGPIWVWA